MRLAGIIFFCVLCLPFGLAAQNLNRSIAPEKPKSTPYGLQITRSDDLKLREANIKSVDDLPSLAPYLDAFADAEVKGGPYDFRLTEPLHDLGRAQRDAGDPRRAMQSFRRALHVARVNNGLYTPVQLPVLDDIIDTHLAMGTLDEADKLQAVRYQIQLRAYPADSTEREQATTEYIEWQRQAYLQGIGEDDSYRRLLDMHVIHTADIERLEKADPNSPELVPHLYDRMLVEYLISRYNGEKQSSLQINVTGTVDGDPVMDGQLEGERFRQLTEFNFRNGLKTLKWIERIEESREEVDPTELARAKMALGDWYLWWQRAGRALENYEGAWAVLSEDGSASTEPDALFPHPVELPDTKIFHSDGLTVSEDIKARARVSLTVTKEGKAREIEILEQEPPEDMGARVVLFRLLREVRFRPVVRDGAAVPVASVVREYRYQY